jgi:hypothetical protein
MALTSLPRDSADSVAYRRQYAGEIRQLISSCQSVVFPFSRCKMRIAGSSAIGSVLMYQATVSRRSPVAANTRGGRKRVRLTSPITNAAPVCRRPGASPMDARGYGPTPSRGTTVLHGSFPVTLHQAARSHSITSSARSSNDSGIVKPCALAVLRLSTNSNLVGCSTGISPAFVPRRILST